MKFSISAVVALAAAASAVAIPAPPSALIPNYNTLNGSIEDIDRFNAILGEMAPNMIYLGVYGRKGWYAFHDSVTQEVANENCTTYGMRLGIIDSQAELEFIANAATQPTYHTDGNLLCQPGSFRWSTGLRELNPDLEIYQASYGLGLYKELKRLQSPGSSMAVSPYLCYLSLVATENKKVNRERRVSGSLGSVENGDLPNQNLTGLTHIGKYGYKNWYYDNALVHWPAAKDNCMKMGMTFGRIDSQAELEWIVSVLPHNQIDAVWTDGETKPVTQAWYWVSTGNPLNSDIAVHDPSWGLALRQSPRNLVALSKTHPSHTFSYICFLAVTA